MQGPSELADLIEYDCEPEVCIVRVVFPMAELSLMLSLRMMRQCSSCPRTTALVMCKKCAPLSVCCSGWLSRV